ncbi:MAG: hypothetical protein A3F70_09275 [Acidobacteria bacterium RIFCSPLOWO2_12_FULL_67_14]|nr:MAG: hypothetical protein A3F70_09275 [Acidobacteria bacterium RIFCSPLOWO2_12_FULL_67_14]
MTSVFSSAARVQRIPRSWTTLAGSVVFHGATAAFLVFAGAAASVVSPEPETHLTYVYVPPPVVPPAVKLPPLPKEQVKLVEIQPRPAEPPPIPERIVVREEPVLPNPEPRPSPVELPRPKAMPTVSVGAFERAASARATELARTVEPAGFDAGSSGRTAELARTVQPAGFDSSVARTTDVKAAAANVGAFDGGATVSRSGVARLSAVRDAGFGTGTGAGTSAGSGRGGKVVSGGFDAGGGGGSKAAAPAGAVKTVDFDTPQAAQTGRQAIRQAPTELPLEILSKPTPAYTDEARAMKIEGEVVLDVEFGAAGDVRVLRVVRGLGHGLDESAMRAVQSIRFKPALRNGQPVETRTTLNIIFRLA